MSLRINVEELNPRCAVVGFEGTLTLGMDLRFADSHLRGLLEKGITKLAFDLTGVSLCDSAGLGVIVHTYGLTKEQGGMLRLFGLSSKVAQVLKITTTDSFIPIDPDRATAVTALTV